MTNLIHKNIKFWPKTLQLGIGKYKTKHIWIYKKKTQTENQRIERKQIRIYYTFITQKYQNLYFTIDKYMNISIFGLFFLSFFLCFFSSSMCIIWKCQKPKNSKCYECSYKQIKTKIKINSHNQKKKYIKIILSSPVGSKGAQGICRRCYWEKFKFIQMKIFR